MQYERKSKLLFGIRSWNRAAFLGTPLSVKRTTDAIPARIVVLDDDLTVNVAMVVAEITKRRFVSVG